MYTAFLLTLVGALPLASGHIALWHPSMYGFNVTATQDTDNRPMAPLMHMTFDQWWFHGHLDHPPNPGDFFELHPGQRVTAELACNKGQTSYWASSEGHTDGRQGNNPCTSEDGSFPSGAMHTTGFDDLTGCALAIAYESDVSKIQPEDFTVFSVNHTCVWTRETDFQVPERMPPCGEHGCHCAWFWIHSPDSGGEQNYMNGFKCKVVNSTSTVALAKPQIPRRCGADPSFGKQEAALGNCTYGAKQPFYWFQNERNNMYEGEYAPPFYTDLYNFRDGAQDDIFEDSYPQNLPAPSADSTFVPTPYLGGGQGPVGETSSTAPVSSSNTPTETSSITSPSPPLSTSSPSSDTVEAETTSVIVSTEVSTSVVLSTVVVTVTLTQAPGSTAAPGPASSFPVSPSSPTCSESTDGGPSPTSTFMATEPSPPANGNAVAGSTIILNTVPATIDAVASNYGAFAADTNDKQGAGRTITLSAKTNHFSSVRRQRGVLAAETTASPTGHVFKREYGERKMFRRRVVASQPANEAEQTKEESSVFSWIGIGRERKLTNRSRLWYIF